jgi:hypothetical protein
MRLNSAQLKKAAIPLVTGKTNGKAVLAAAGRPLPARLQQRGNVMRDVIQAVLTVVTGLVLVGSASAQAPPNVGTEEFGLTHKELVQVIEKVEGLIAQCMREQGFEYVAADYSTVRRGMNADKSLPGLSEEEFIDKYGFGISTLYSGAPPQLAQGYSPAQVGLGERNVQIYKNLSPADQVAYNRALLGENTDATFAVALELENLSRCGGCTRSAVEQVFKPDQLKANYYNPKDALINNHPRMKSALRVYAEEMRDAGFAYNHPDEVEPDIRERLDALTSGGTIPLEKMLPEQLAALKKLQDYERRVATKSFELQERIFEPVEEQIEKEMFAREVK